MAKVKNPPTPSALFPRSFSCLVENQECMSKNFERWKALADLTSKEQDPEKLTQLANEMNRVLTQKTPDLDPPLREPLE